MVKKPNFIKNLIYVILHPRYVKAQTNTFSFWSIIFNVRKLRKDYIEHTAQRYYNNNPQFSKQYYIDELKRNLK